MYLTAVPSHLFWNLKNSVIRKNQHFMNGRWDDKIVTSRRLIYLRISSCSNRAPFICSSLVRPEHWISMAVSIFFIQSFWFSSKNHRFDNPVSYPPVAHPLFLSLPSSHPPESVRDTPHCVHQENLQLLSATDSLLPASLQIYCIISCKSPVVL